jgi:hypothetical protein
VGFGLGLVGLHLSRVRMANAGICRLCFLWLGGWVPK